MTFPSPFSTYYKTSEKFLIFHEQKKVPLVFFSFDYSYPLSKTLVKLSKTGLTHMPNTNSPFLLCPCKKEEKVSRKGDSLPT